MKYSILILWSEEDNAYIASLPEWGKYARTHGSTHQEAIDNAQEVLGSSVCVMQWTGVIRDGTLI